jgi:putative FmdB family regulatory protein
MPLYEYFCADCRTRFEVLRPMSQADEKIACEKCEGRRTSRVLSVFFASSGGKALDGMGAGGCACGGACSCGHSHN